MNQQEVDLTTKTGETSMESDYVHLSIPTRKIAQYSMDIHENVSPEPIGYITEYWINGEWIQPVSRDYQDRAERYEKLATSTQVLLNLSMNEIKTLNEKVEELEEKIWQLKTWPNPDM